MPGFNPSRRPLLCGLVAGLFGWLTVPKSAARPASPSPDRTPALTSLNTITTRTYDANGCLLAEYSTHCERVTRVTYDGVSRRTTITDL
jgi:YD repeat-containing protein